jgi:hypothetical protein
MSDFDLDKKLPSTRVTRELIAALERYVLSRAEQLSSKGPDAREALAKCSTTTIEDDLGSETFSTITEYVHALFSDATRAVNVHFRVYEPSLPRISIKINFSTEKSGTGIRIYYSGPNARETVMGLYDGLLECVKRYPAGNALYNPHPAIQGALTAVTVGAFWVVPLLWRIWPLANAVLLVVFWVLLFVYLIVMPRIRPYTVFDSHKAKQYEEAWRWTIRGLIGFVVFSSFLTILRDKVVSFLSK